MFPRDTRILIVDDFMTGRLIVKKALHELGFKNIEEAKNGEEGWSALLAAGASEPFQLVITDWNMPVMSGLELIKVMRGDTRFGKIPILLITAEGGHSEIIEALEAGASSMIIKPFSSEQLNEKLDEMFSVTLTASLG